MLTVLHIGASTLTQIWVRRVGPTTAKTKQLYLWTDRRYICGNLEPIEVFLMMWKLRYGNYIDSHNYNPLGSSADEGRVGLIT